VKTGIPGQVSNVAVTHEWTVPATATTTGMLRVFQTFGGNVATNPSNPGDYTLFSPLFTISATTGVRDARAKGASPLRVHDDGIEIRFDRISTSGAATLDVVGVDGSLRRTITLGTVDSRTPAARWTAKELGGTGAVLLRLRIEGVTVAQERMILLP